MKTYSVTFLPEEKTVQAAKGKTLLEAAAAAGMAINAICGGDGVCGKCRVVVKSGKVAAKPTMFLSRRDIQRGVALACQTYIDGDVVVEVPLESRIGGIPQLVSEDAVRFGKVVPRGGQGARFAHKPLARKMCLDLPKPNITDNICDQERLFREIRRSGDIPIMQTGLNVLRKLPALLRENNWKVTALLGLRGGTVEVMDIEPGDTAQVHYGVAIDVGTTTVVAHLVDLVSPKTLATKAKYNSQIAFGDDVIARIMSANTEAGLRALHEPLINDINDLIAALVVEAQAKLNEVTYIVCAGNTSMMHFLFRLDPSNIRREPYIACASQPPVIRAAEVGVNINPRGLLAVVPAVACYVGGDVVADVMVSGMADSEELSMLIDMGTNGELILGNSEWMLCCSASAGPAFEGAGITCGMRAMNGAIEKLDLTKGGEVAACGVVGGGKPLGLCGSGLIDAVAELLRVGCIDRAGRFVEAVCGPKLRETAAGGWEFELFRGQDTALGREIVLTENDIRNLIHTKGSIYMAAECLLDHVGKRMNEIKHVYIAGGFGNYLAIAKAISIGLLPDLDHDCFQFIGNGSVQGAKMALLSEDAMNHMAHRIAAPMTYVDLSSNHKYMNEYSSCLFLPHTDLERFPSATARGGTSRLKEVGV